MFMNWIEPGVLAASALPNDANDVTSLHAQGIRAIVTLTERPLTARVPAEVLEQLGLVTLHVAVDDMTAPTKEQADEVVAFIDRMQAEGKPVLVHCKVGQGRTGVILHSYYLSKGYSLPETKERVATQRGICDYRNLSPVQQAFIEEYAQGRTVFI
jgi:protein-tyrosine phosphatase